MRALLVVAESSLIVEAITIGLRRSGEFTLVGQLQPRAESAHSAEVASADVVLIDEPEERERLVALIREFREAAPQAALIALTLSTEPDWLDELFAAGAVGAVSKATQPAALATLIRETLDGRVLSLHRPPGAGGATQRAADGPLSPRELEVLRLVASGSTNGEIARRLWVTEQTVKFHLSNIYRKLDVGNRTEASRYAHLHGLVEQPEAD